jgi:hypothetical protein
LSQVFLRDIAIEQALFWPHALSLHPAALGITLSRVHQYNVADIIRLPTLPTLRDKCVYF